jgi:CheY-like chemotaxis protein
MTVTDTGVGMDNATMEHLFEPFFSTKEPGNGTGLGMAMAYGIVKQHDGWIDVQSAPGAGTTISVLIPVETAPVVRASEAPEPESLPRGDETVLLAEDEPSVQRFVCGVLEDLGYTVLVASDGEQAIQLFSEQSRYVDLLVLDAKMPKASGSSAYAAMRVLRPDIPVLFITGYSDEIARLTSTVGASVNILRKPFGPSDLAHRVRDTLTPSLDGLTKNEPDQVTESDESSAH